MQFIWDEKCQAELRHSKSGREERKGKGVARHYMLSCYALSHPKCTLAGWPPVYVFVAVIKLRDSLCQVYVI
jgi:hypothetical protein